MRYNNHLRLLVTFFVSLTLTCSLLAQENTNVQWTSEQQLELFGYCEKPFLIKQLKLSPETADKIGQIHFWARWQEQKIANNTNDTFATAGEIEEAVVKKYKTLSLSGDQLKSLIERRKNGANDPCEVLTIKPNPSYDTLTKEKLTQLYKTKYRRALMDQLEVNGKQADMLIDAEVWRQKELFTVAAIPVTDFNRIRKAVELFNEREKKYRFIGLTDQQKEGALAFFRKNE
jgi:hypothetical protein